MNRFLEQFGTRGFMDMHQSMSMGPHVRMELSRKTPVIDHLEGFPEFYEALATDLEHHNVVDLFAIGKSGIGKGAVIEQTLRKIDDDPRFKATRRNKGVTKQYYSLATEFQDAVQELGVVSPWGPFTPEELEEGAKKASFLGVRKLHVAQNTASKPLVRGFDFISVAVPVDLGASHLVSAIQRQKLDRKHRYTYRIIAVKTDTEVQGRSLRDRQALWELPPDADRGDILKVLHRSKIKPDEEELNIDKIRRSYGHPIGLQMVNGLIHSQIVARQDEIRQKVNPSFPHINNPNELDHDPQLLSLAEDSYYRLLLFHDFKADPERTLIVSNTFLDRQIPFYTRRTSKYRIH